MLIFNFLSASDQRILSINNEFHEKILWGMIRKSHRENWLDLRVSGKVKLSF